ncbi:amino acid transporter [Agrococcus sp. UYP10]|uniref:APC family permease n=1 Tax=Agrococcus sp. UYP10 TaxID=1756355 RepID=UPI00339B4888
MTRSIERTAEAAPKGGVTRKGLSIGKVGVIGGAIIGVSAVAPAYTLTSGLGPVVAEVGLQVPAVLLIGFVPMLFVLFGYRELNAAMPDSGTSFTWATRAFGPWIGWMAGWGLVASTILVLSNLAAVAVDFLFILLAQVTGDDSLADLTGILWLNLLITGLFVAGAAWISYRGVDATKKVQIGLVVFQVGALVWYAIAAFVAVGQGNGFDPQPVTADWFNPLAASSLSAMSAGVSLAIFLFWGWDTVVTMNEEAKDPKRTPGRAAIVTIVVTMALYLLVTIATLAYAGVGETGLGAGNPENQESIFAVLAEPIMGPFAILISIAILLSSAASLQSTMISPSRTILAMGHYGAMPRTFSTVSPRFRSPSVATLASAITAMALYAVMKVLSENALWDTISALGMMVCFYYGITGLAAVWFFRRSWFRSVRSALTRLVLPLLGGVALLALFCKTAIDSIDPAYGSGSAIFATRWDADGMAQDGVGLVFVASIGILVLGVVLMLLQARRAPAFFRGEVLPVAVDDPEAPDTAVLDAHHDGTAAADDEPIARV